MPGKKRKEATKATTSQKKRKVETNKASSRPKKYKQWTEDLMLGALEAISQGMGINTAAMDFEGQSFWPSNS